MSDSVMQMKMRRSGYSIDVVNTKDINTPECAHGPTLLFEEYRGSEVKRFFACSAFRDRKECPFYQLADSKKTNHDVAVDKRFEVIPSTEECRKRLDKYKLLSDADRSMCQQCGVLLLPHDRLHHDPKHTVICPVKLASLDHPTTLFHSISKAKSFSQFMFTNKAVQFIVDSLTSIGYRRLLCVGTPTIHEHIQMRRRKGDKSVESLLLDLDKRYQQTWPTSFCHYNLFNHHFFELSDERVFESFMVNHTGQSVVILDPPFGGLVDPIATTLEKISQVCSGEVKTVWFFPYFLESRMQQSCPSLVMLDYQVDYDNHNLFQSGGRKHGSPVRIYTNITPSAIVLPHTLGYWFCSVCKAYRHSQNWHCDACASCTSKDGSKYVHCELCRRCVKPSRVHCVKCKQCAMQDHKCGQTLGTGCHICGDVTHKRRDCPSRPAPINKRKKKSNPGNKKKTKSI